MTINELKKKVETCRNGLESKEGAICRCTKKGPVGISLIDDIVTVLEKMQSQIDDLKKRPGIAG